MGRRRQSPKAPASPRSANVDPMYVQWLEMTQLAGTDSIGIGMPYSLRKALAKTPHVAAIIQTFVNWGADFAQPQPTPYSIGWRVSKSDRRAPYTPKDWRVIDEISEVINRAGWEWFPGGFEAYLKATVRDTLVQDWSPCEVIREEFGGRPWAFIPVDPVTIRRAFPTAEVLEDYRWDYDEIAFKQVIWNGSTNEEVAEFTNEEMFVGVRRNSTDILRAGYGYPELEEFATIITGIINCIVSNAVGVTTGVHANQIIALISKMDDRNYEMFRMELQSMLTGVRNNKRTPVVRLNPDRKDDIRAIPLGQTNEDMQFMDWIDFLERLLCAGYNVDQRVVFPKTTDADRGDVNKLTPTDRALQSKERGFRPVLRSIASWLNHGLLRWPGWLGYRFDFVGFDSQSERDKLEMDIKAVGSYLSPNELRAERNLPPFDDPISMRPLNSLYQSWIQTQIEQGMPIPGVDTQIDNISAWVNGRRLPSPSSPA